MIREIADKRLINFHDVDRQVVQPSKRGTSSSKIVYRHLHTMLSHRLKFFDGTNHILHQYFFIDFDLQSAGFKPVRAQRTFDLRQQAARFQQLLRYVDREDNVGRSSMAPGCYLPAG